MIVVVRFLFEVCILAPTSRFCSRFLPLIRSFLFPPSPSRSLWGFQAVFQKVLETLCIIDPTVYVMLLHFVVSCVKSDQTLMMRNSQGTSRTFFTF